MSLKDMLNKQKEFQDKTNMHPFAFELGSAVAAEGSEIWGASGGKWWKKKYGNIVVLLNTHTKERLLKIESENRLKIIEESVDALHFLLELWNRLGVSPEAIQVSYELKLKENYRRMESEY